jgi:hypothetical protein
MASTTPVGGYAPGTNDVPGMQGGRDPATNGGHRNVAFLDAGACSKMLRSLPSMTSFFRNVRKSVSGLQTQSASNSSAIKNLLHAQANLNDQSNQLNYWMRKTSPELDKLSSELVAGNDALASLPDNSSLLDAPNVPDGITLLPGAALNNLVLYFARPSYTGASEVAGYELVTFASASDALTMTNPTTPAGLDASALSETALTAALAAPWTTANADEFYGVYGADLRFVSSGLATGGAGQGLSVRLRAYNTSGANGANLYSDWSAPTLLVCAASSPTELQPVVESVTTGASFSLVAWRRPSVRQPDGSYAIIGGVHSYTIEGTTVVGGVTSVAQVVLAPTVTSVIVGACTTADGTTPVAQSAPFPVVVPATLPQPELHVTSRTDADTGKMYVTARAIIPDPYYEPGLVTYALTAIDQTAGTSTVVRTESTSPDALGATSHTFSEYQLTPLHTYYFSVVATDAASHTSPSSQQQGPFAAGALLVPSYGAANTVPGTFNGTSNAYAVTPADNSTGADPTAGHFQVTGISKLFAAASASAVLRLVDASTNQVVYTATAPALLNAGAVLQWQPCPPSVVKENRFFRCVVNGLVFAGGAPVPEFSWFFSTSGQRLTFFGGVWKLDGTMVGSTSVSFAPAPHDLNVAPSVAPTWQAAGVFTAPVQARLQWNGADVAGTATTEYSRVVFTPTNPLVGNRVYTVVVPDFAFTTSPGTTRGGFEYQFTTSSAMNLIS